MYDTIIMDLDGTLTDPGVGITNSIMYALEKFGIHVENRESLYRFIGPPLLTELRKVFGFSEEDSKKAVAYYREYFAEKGLFENEVYANIPETLEKIRASGRKLVVATSKPEVYSIRILEYFDLMRYFDHVAGSTMDSTRVEKADVIAYALREFGIPAEKTVMVGDRQNDIFGAKRNGLDSIGVLYGYGSKEELQKAGAQRFAAAPEEILKFI